MSVFIDRRPNSNKKNNINKKKFIDRNSEDIDKSIKKIIESKSIDELSDKNERFNISISQDGIKEPKIRKDSRTGNSEQVYPFNDQYSVGDRIPKPKGQGGKGVGEGEASNEGEGEDGFEFQLSQEDFIDYLFKNMELPHLNKTNVKNASYKEKQRAGFTSSGNPSSLCVKTSYIKSLQRKIAIESSFDKKIIKMKENNETQENIDIVENKKRKIPFIAEHDLMYKHSKEVIKPSTQAVIFCVMDISGSVSQDSKELSKVFFLLLYLFLNKNYKDVEIRFISHTTVAKEVTEHEFFYSKETGGTIVSSAFEKVNEIIDAEYNSNEWNIYISQSSDGDNWGDDNTLLINLLKDELLEKVNYMTYIEVNAMRKTSLESAYAHLKDNENFKMAKINSQEEVYTTLLELFKKRS